jgi:rhamnopyranosyl-N-acetylglucosaminyl-diphospho-decaprenol beta-1,3/1,4-galactofuranosyltransferase
MSLIHAPLSPPVPRRQEGQFWGFRPAKSGLAPTAWPPAPPLPAGTAARPMPEPAASEVVAVVVTRDRPALLRRCLDAMQAQVQPPGRILVIDNASEDATATAAAVAGHAATLLRMPTNLGGAGGYRAGIEAALAAGAAHVWLMDDDGCAADPHCLEHLLAAAAEGIALAAPLVLDEADAARLAFPVRFGGRTRFRLADLQERSHIDNFAHLFNGALIAAEVFRRIGLPEPRFFLRGDEVEFMHRALRAGLAVRIEVAARFLHPSGAEEIHPIMFGLFYATEPPTELKRYYQFRNRGYIFRAYGKWDFLLADIVRYGWFYLISRRGDLPGFGRWLRTTAIGWRGAFLSEDAASGPHGRGA